MRMQVREAVPPGRAVEHRFYLVTTLAMLLAVVIGFSRSFFLRPLFPGWPSPSEPFFYVHGVLFAAWCVLLAGQAALVSGGRTPLHRTVGWYGAGLATAMVATGTYAALLAANRPTGFTGIPVPPLQFLAVPGFDIVLFSAFVALAVVKRRDAQVHKRLMLLATVNLLAAAFARWPLVYAAGNPVLYFGLADLFIVAMAIRDLRTRGRLHPVVLWGGLTIIASQPLRLAVSGTPAWLVFASWAAGLVR
jgi:hypothetical protein